MSYERRPPPGPLSNLDPSRPSIGSRPTKTFKSENFDNQRTFQPSGYFYIINKDPSLFIPNTLCHSLQPIIWGKTGIFRGDRRSLYLLSREYRLFIEKPLCVINLNLTIHSGFMIFVKFWILWCLCLF